MTVDSPAPIADAAERERALDPTRSFIVQAPAGSGKTALLTRRVLKLLASVKEPEEILAITFTRKAAAEMRARVVEALSEAQASERPESDFEKEGYDLAKAVLDRDKELDWRLLDNPDRIRMSTIDALCSMLAQQLPVTSTLGGIANPVDDASALYREAARRRLKFHTNQYQELLKTVGNRFDQAERLLASMLSNRDQWLRYRDLFELEDRATLRAWLEDQLSDLVTRELVVLEQCVIDGRVDHLLKKTLLPLLQQATSVMDVLDVHKPGSKEAREPFSTLAHVPELSADHLPVWKALITCLFTATQKTLRKKVTRSEGFPSSAKDLSLIELTKDEAIAGRDAINSLLVALTEAPGVEASMAAVLALPEPKYAEHQWDLLEELLTELPELEQTLHQVFVDHGEIDFIEISTRARCALGTDDEPTDLALAMDLRLQHILVDEFQDTSRSQFALFRLLVAGWQKGDNRTFFVVGDPMQSIYAFRAAEVGLFGTARELGISDDVQLEPLTLKVNFRSSPDVVAWVNETFENIFVPEDKADPAIGAIAYSSSTAHQSIPGAVKVHPLLNTGVDEAAEQIAALVDETLTSEEYAKNPDHRIAILVRSRTAAVPIFHALQSRGIANLSVDMDSLGEQAVVMDLVSLTIALRFPHSRLHWLSVLRSPWCGLTLNDLHALTHDVETSRAIPTLLVDETRIANLSVDGQVRLGRFMNAALPAIERASRSSLVSWVESVWLQLGGAVLCTRAVDRNAADRCLRTLYELEANGDLWQPQTISAAMDRLFAVTPDDGTAKVHIMTMHKSKGLEFDTVILPGLNRAPRSGDTQLLDWAVMDSDGDGRSALLLAPMTERNAPKQESALGRLVKSVKASGDEQETRRLLYVACTRAERQLHLVTSLKVPASGELKAPARSLLEPLWPSVQEHFHKAMADLVELDDETDDSSKPEAVVTVPGLRRVASDWTVPQLPNYEAPNIVEIEEMDEAAHEVDYLWAGRRARAIGTVVHRHMERFHSRGLPEPGQLETIAPVVSRQLHQQGLPESELESSTQSVLDALKTVAEDENGRWLYDSSHTDARAEWAVTAGSEERTERRVIDRTFVTNDGTRWIVDFKTGDHKGGDLEGFLASEVDRHGPQLRRYAEILSTLDSAPIRLGLYFPLLQAFREVSPGEE